MNNVIEQLQEMGLELKKVSDTNGGEYKGPCPECGGNDRLTVSPDHPKYQVPVFICRQCGIKGHVNKIVESLGEKPIRMKSRKVRTNKSQSSYPPSETWQKSLKKIIRYYAQNDITCNIYKDRGLSKKTVQDLKLSAIYSTIKVTPDNDTVQITPGLLIPNFRGDTLWGIQTRNENRKTKFQYVKGSKAVPYHFTKVEELEVPTIIVESALDAAILYQEAGDLIHAVALGSATNRPDQYIRTLLSKSSRVFVCMDYDQAGFEALIWWRKEYPESLIVYPPTGKDIGEFHQAGNSVREWVQEVISGNIKPRSMPDFEAYELSKDELPNVLTSGPVGVSISKNYIALAADGIAQVMEIKDLPGNALKNLNLVTYDGLEFLRKMPNCQAPDCISLQHHALTNKKSSLDKISQYYLGYSGADYDTGALRAAVEAHACLQIFELQDRKIKEAGVEKYYKLLKNAQPALAMMSRNGMPFDLEKHKQVREHWSSALDQADTSSLDFMLSNYGDKLAGYVDPKTSRIFSDFNFHGTITGRLVNTPYLMGMPKNEIRSVFAAPQGRILIGADYSQIDLRVAAILSKDQQILQAFREGRDIHRMTAAHMFSKKEEEVTDVERKEAKKAVYAALYGGNSECMKAFSGLQAWIALQKKGHQYKMTVTTPSRRVIKKDPFNSNGWQKKLINWPIQAGSSEIMLAALGRLPTLLDKIDAQIVLTVHDEVIVEAAEDFHKEATTALITAMTEGFLDVFPGAPVKNLVNIQSGKTWEQLK